MSPNFDEMSSIDLQKFVKSEIKSKKLYMETMPPDFAFKIRDEDEQKVDFRRELGRWKSDIILLTREFDTEKICILIPIRKYDYENDENSGGGENSDNDDDDGENSDNNGSENSDNNGGENSDADENSDDGENRDNNVGENSDNNGGDGGRRGAPAPFKITVEITKQNGKTLGFIVSAPDNDITVESMSIKFRIDDSFDKAAEYMVDKDGDLQSSLREYLKSRGIKKSSVDFMYEYVVRKTKQAPMSVLNGLQVFMED